MSDPKNIPLSEAKAGDIVHLKPMKFMQKYGENRAYVLGGWIFAPEHIDRIERAPRPLEVGDRVLTPKCFIGEILMVKGGWAWVGLRDFPAPSTYLLADLERVDG